MFKIGSSEFQTEMRMAPSAGCPFWKQASIEKKQHTIPPPRSSLIIQVSETCNEIDTLIEILPAHSLLNNVPFEVRVEVLVNDRGWLHAQK